jgi:hypothetical protein
MRWGKMVCFCLGVISLFLGGNEAGRAADWVLTPSIETRAEYLNNIFYSARLKKSDYILSAVPNLDFTYNTEVTQLGGSLKLSGLHYLQNPNLDTINQFYNINGSTMATSRLRLNLGLAYLNTTNSQEAVNVTNIFTFRQRTSALTVSPGLTYFLAERWSTDLTYRFYNVDYQSNPLSSYMTHTINDRLNYLYNEKTTFIASITADYSQYQELGNTIAALGPQIGLEYKFSEKWGFTFLGGANFSQIESNVRTSSFNNLFGFINTPKFQKQRTSNVGPFINIITNYRWTNGGINFTYTRSQSPSAYQNQSQYNNFNLSFDQNLTERLRFAVNPYFNIDTIQGGNSNYNQYYYGISPQLNYKLTEKTSIGVNYRLSYVNYTGVQNYGYNINDVYVFLNYSYPIHYQR